MCLYEKKIGNYNLELGQTNGRYDTISISERTSFKETLFLSIIPKNVVLELPITDKNDLFLKLYDLYLDEIIM